MRHRELIERGAKPSFELVALAPHFAKLALDVRELLLEDTRALVGIRCEREDGVLLRWPADAWMRAAEAARARRGDALPHRGKTRGRSCSPRSAHT